MHMATYMWWLKPDRTAFLQNDMFMILIGDILVQRDAALSSR